MSCLNDHDYVSLAFTSKPHSDNKQNACLMRWWQMLKKLNKWVQNRRWWQLLWYLDLSAQIISVPITEKLRLDMQKMVLKRDVWKSWAEIRAFCFVLYTVLVVMLSADRFLARQGANGMIQFMSYQRHLMSIFVETFIDFMCLRAVKNQIFPWKRQENVPGEVLWSCIFVSWCWACWRCLSRWALPLLYHFTTISPEFYWYGCWKDYGPGISTI